MSSIIQFPTLNLFESITQVFQAYILVLNKCFCTGNSLMIIKKNECNENSKILGQYLNVYRVSTIVFKVLIDLEVWLWGFFRHIL